VRLLLCCHAQHHSTQRVAAPAVPCLPGFVPCSNRTLQQQDAICIPAESAALSSSEHDSESLLLPSAAGKVLIPTSHFIRTLVAARLAADVADVPTVLIARTDADSASLLTSDIDEDDKAFCTGERTPEGFFKVKCGVEVRSWPSFSHALLRVSCI